MQLEDQPGLVKDFRIGPDGNHILLQKGFVFVPGVWQDDRYYLLDLNQQTVQPIPLPEDVINPAVTWSDQGSLQVIHQVMFMGGTHLSLIDIATIAATQIYPGRFFRPAPFWRAPAGLPAELDGKYDRVGTP
jgi:hypothetical protein